jgi:hypothetical protein
MARKMHERELLIRYDDELKCLVGMVQGVLDASAIERYVEAVLDKAEEHDCTCILSDMRGAKLALSTLEIYDFPRLFERSRLGPPWKGALVVGGDKEDFQFLETVAQNRGFMLRIFAEYDQAVRWLAGRDRAPGSARAGTEVTVQEHGPAG